MFHLNRRCFGLLHLYNRGIVSRCREIEHYRRVNFHAFIFHDLLFVFFVFGSCVVAYTSPTIPLIVTPSPSDQLTSSLPTTTSIPTPSLSQELSSVTVTRTPSTVSTVSSIAMRSSVFDSYSIMDFPLDDVSTEPSLLSTHRSATPRSLSPAGIPLPSSPSSSLPSVSLSVSMSTPQTNIPSVHSVLETISSEGRSEILTHDVNRLLQYLHELEGNRAQDNEGLHDHMREIERELSDLQDYLRSQEVPEVPPPVPRKDHSVGSGSIIWSIPATPMSPRPRLSMPASPRPPIEAAPRSIPPAMSASPRPLVEATTRAVPRVMAGTSLHLVPVPLTPPPLRMSSPSSLSHSDDFSLMESETYPIKPSSPFSSSSPVSTPSSSFIDLSSFVISESDPTSGAYLSHVIALGKPFKQDNDILFRTISGTVSYSNG
ncbi:hypothetical protein EW146_g10071 [Bondarzewia mesenterica]|uniref:Uncharacterized protein n=1 Tax=Bondarzewia mesenterica TaxID=1095465 RepID=A0A4S4L0M8_9AGAM|nr:hypothetical protein EW146_g10071 [Bondarzewia mesenterica]